MIKLTLTDEHGTQEVKIDSNKDNIHTSNVIEAFVSLMTLTTYVHLNVVEEMRDIAESHLSMYKEEG